MHVVKNSLILYQSAKCYKVTADELHDSFSAVEVESTLMPIFSEYKDNEIPTNIASKDRN